MNFPIKNRKELDEWFAAGMAQGNSFSAVRGKPPAGMTYSDGSRVTGEVNVHWRCDQTGEKLLIIYDCPTVNRVAGPIEQGHPESTCEDCGGANVVWFAPSPLWNQVVRQNSGCDVMLCPTCFIIRAVAAGVKATAWVVQPEQL